MEEKTIFIEALNEVVEGEITEYMDSLPIEDQPEYSSGYENKMRKLIKRQRKPYFTLISTAGRRAACIVAAVIVFSASALSVKALRATVFDFTITESSDHNDITIESGTASSYPTRIEHVYYISALPEGFIEVAKDQDVYDFYTYEYANGDKYICFSQRTKSGFMGHYDNEHSQFSEYIDEDGQKYIQIISEYGLNTFIWDNGEYIFEISSNLDKEAVINLCKSTKF